MAWLDKKDVEILLEAGFAEEDLGLVEGGRPGVTLYESPGDYFTKELIENACEQGLCDLYDENHLLEPAIAEPYDTSHKGLYEDDEYPGTEDPTIDVPASVRPQVEWLKSVNIGKLSVWQSRKEKSFKWPVKRIDLNIPSKDWPRLNRLSQEDRKLAFKGYARDAWQELWKNAVSTLYSKACERVNIETSSGSINLIVISADDMRELGHNVPGEAKWITLLYFEKDSQRPLIRPRSHI